MENSAKSKSRYFFSCNFMWWIFHFTFPLNDELESQLDDSMLDRIDDFDIRSEELGEWYIEEALQAVKIFVIGESKSESLYTCSLLYEDKLNEIVKTIDPFVLECFPDNYYKALFYCKLNWLNDMIVNYSEIMDKISLDQFNQTYSLGKEKNEYFMNWIKQNLFELSIEIGEDKITQMEGRFVTLKNELTKRWESLVEEAVLKHTLIE